ncbi:MAG: hypothetical protein ABJ084_06160 [Halioglobus sp.]
MKNGFAKLVGRFSLAMSIIFTIAACGGGGSSSGGFIPDNGGGSTPDIPLEIITTGLPQGTSGIGYTALVEATGGSEPYAWAVIDDGGTGFTINNEGIISGVSPEFGDYGLTLEVTDDGGETDKVSIIFTVTGEAPQPLAIATTTLPPGTTGQNYIALLQATGGEGDYMWTLNDDGGTGLDLRDDGVLQGNAPDAGQYVVTVSVMDDTSEISTNLLYTVDANPSSLAITTSSLPGATVGERYAAVLNASGGSGSYSWRLTSDGGSGFSISAEGILTGVPVVAGTFGLIFEVNDGADTAESALILTIAAMPGAEEQLTIETETLPDADRVLYAASVDATGGFPPYSWSGGDTGSPGTGFIVDAVSGTITGDTNNLLPGLYGYSVTVSDSVGDVDTQSYVITVPGGDKPPISILTANPLDNALEGQTYTTILRAVGGSGINTWSIIDATGFPGTAPAFSDTSAGILLWSAADVAAGNYLITIQVSDTEPPNSADVVTFDLQASSAPVRITSDTILPGGIVGTAYSQTLSVQGGGATNTWSATVTPDNGGPEFAGAGIMSGTLTWTSPVAGDYTVTVKVVSEDGTGVASSDEKAFSLQILP